MRCNTLRTIPIAFSSRTVQIKPRWAGKGIAIHKPLRINPATREVFFSDSYGWILTHIKTGRSLGECMGSLDRAKSFANAWDAEFAALEDGYAMAPDRVAAWMAVVEEMRTELPMAPRVSQVRRGVVIDQEVNHV